MLAGLLVMTRWLRWNGTSATKMPFVEWRDKGPRVTVWTTNGKTNTFLLRVRLATAGQAMAFRETNGAAGHWRHYCGAGYSRQNKNKKNLLVSLIKKYKKYRRNS